MKRKPDWVAALRREVELAERASFGYGKHDCAIFAARCVDAMTGSNIRDSFIEVVDARTTVSTLRDAGGLEAAVTARLGAPIETGLPRRGDVCLTNPNQIGVCVGTTIAIPSHAGLAHYAITDAIKHWRVG